MKRCVGCVATAMIFLLGSNASLAEQTSMPGLTIMIKAKTGPQKGMNVVISMSILGYLMKHKMPQWDFVDSSRRAKAMGAELSAAMFVESVDVVVEFVAETKKADNVVELTVSARNVLLDKQLFAKSATSARRDLGRPGALSKAVNDVVGKVMPGFSEELKKYYWSLARDGHWSRVMLENAPGIVVEKVRQELERSCKRAERLPGKPGFLVRCKLDNLELYDRVDKAIKAASPGVDYEILAKTRKNIRLKFKQAKQEVHKRKRRKRKR